MKHIKLFEQFVNERNAFLAARAKAIEEGLDEFEFNGKIYPIKSKASKQQVVSEAEIKSDAEFKEYAETVLKKAFGEDYDEAKGQKNH
jgi:hypothetical protein